MQALWVETSQTNSGVLLLQIHTVSIPSDTFCLGFRLAALVLMVCIIPRRAQSERFGTRIFSETVTKVDLSWRPFKIWTDEKAVEAETVIIATGEGEIPSHYGRLCPRPVTASVAQSHCTAASSRSKQASAVQVLWQRG